MVGAWHRTSLTRTPAVSPAGSRTALRHRTHSRRLLRRSRQTRRARLPADLPSRRAWTWCSAGRPAPDTVFFYADRFFVLIRWQTADRKALHEFVGALEKNFPTRQ